MSLPSRLEPARVGVPAPDFTLPDASGGWCRPFDVFPDRALVVVFYRGHWCPYCRRYLSKLEANVQRIEASGAKLVAVSPEPSTTAAALATELGLTFPLLSDTDGRVINRYGTRNGFMGGGSVLPHPSVFVLDGQGVIRFCSIDRNYKKRTTIRTIMGVLSTLATEVQAAAAPPLVAQPT